MRSRSGGKLNGNDVDAVVEIFAEFAGASHFFERLVGGADQPEIDLAEGAAAEALNLVIFEDAEQLGLQRQGEGRNLVEKERAAVGHFNVSGAGFGGAGERAALAAEEFRFDQVLGKRRTVQPDEGLVGAAAQGDDGARGEFFAGAAFTANEDVDIACGDLLNGVVDEPHRLAGADEVLKAAGLQRLLARSLALGLFAAAADGIEQRDPQFGHVNRVAEVGIGAGAAAPAFRLSERGHGSWRSE